ncbi:protein GAMETOPHYTE DEFECTIVE 1-like [Gastrolobium bilobum]|uniref:protein GAMETOPHYTE DEFECTIVE 1-like n=1 Tax=Gastrolobium bilobum TaxID=150636 RepID=UPI002AB22D03|nr:protein GAMETOPHYTE DEFECTIVE 1-like [Gastrolobium bilobum]
MEVDIISIDFSTKLSFRLKQPMVKAAIKCEACFEVTYSALVADIQIRRQLISSAKVLTEDIVKCHVCSHMLSLVGSLKQMDPETRNAKVRTQLPKLVVIGCCSYLKLPFAIEI